MPTKLIHAALCSLDGYIAGPDGRWEWAVPDEEVHGFVNELVGDVSAHLYGRRMWEVMSWWQSVDLDALDPGPRAWAEAWRATDKHVFSGSLPHLDADRTTLHPSFDPAAVSSLVAAATGTVSIAGGRLASAAARAGLLDELHLITAPAVVGGGIRVLDEGLDLRFELLGSRVFDASGFVWSGYRVVG